MTIMFDRISLVVRLLLAFYAALATAAAQEPLIQDGYKVGQSIPVSCLNRTYGLSPPIAQKHTAANNLPPLHSETGEHVQDAAGELSYIPFPTCNETGRPLELLFGIEKDINCTLDFISDPFFHLLEYYVHNDVPLTCRIPTKPLPPSALISEFEAGTKDDTDGQGSLSDVYTPMIVALTGTLQLSHLHVSSSLNVLVHAAPKSVAPGTIAAATAYSIPREEPTRIIVGDSLPLRFHVRWYPNTALPSGWAGVGGHLTASTVVYCVLSALASAAICVTYFRGVELPRRLKSHGKDRLGGIERGGLGGYGLGSNGYGLGPGKRD